MSIFLAIVLALAGLLHGYVYSRLVAWIEPSDGVLLTLRIGVIVLAVSALATRALERVIPALYRPAWWDSAVWLGLVWQLSAGVKGPPRFPVTREGRVCYAVEFAGSAQAAAPTGSKPWSTTAV